MKVVDHRPPLKRIDFGARPSPVVVISFEECETTKGYRIAEQDRIWRLVERAALSGSVRSDDVEG